MTRAYSNDKATKHSNSRQAFFGQRVNTPCQASKHETLPNVQKGSSPEDNSLNPNPCPNAPAGPSCWCPGHMRPEDNDRKALDGQVAHGSPG